MPIQYGMPQGKKKHWAGNLPNKNEDLFYGRNFDKIEKLKFIKNMKKDVYNLNFK